MCTLAALTVPVVRTSSQSRAEPRRGRETGAALIVPRMPRRTTRRVERTLPRAEPERTRSTTSSGTTSRVLRLQRARTTMRVPRRANVGATLSAGDDLVGGHAAR